VSGGFGPSGFDGKWGRVGTKDVWEKNQRGQILVVG